MNEYLAEGEAALKVTDFVISDKDKKRLGVTYTRVGSNNQITITCSNAGSAIVSVKMIAGGDKVGTNDNPGGMEITKQFALIVREGFSSNGGWM
jgi:archaellum component FlaF (FlaF/FlaG flagellin family)